MSKPCMAGGCRASLWRKFQPLVYHRKEWPCGELQVYPLKQGQALKHTVMWGLAVGVLLISVGLLLGIIALQGTETFWLPPGHYGFSLFLNKKESLGADPLRCNWGIGDKGATAWPGSAFSFLHPEGVSQLHKILLASTRFSGQGGGGRKVIVQWMCYFSPLSTQPPGQWGLGVWCLIWVTHVTFCFSCESLWWVVTRTQHLPVCRDTMYIPAQQGMQWETRSMQHVGRQGVLYENKVDVDKIIKHRLKADKLACT